MAEFPNEPLKALDFDFEQSSQVPLITSTREAVASAAENLLKELGVSSQEAPQKLDEVSQAKKLALGGPDAMHTLGAGAINENDISRNPVFQDLINLSNTSILEKYGKDVADNRWRVIQAVDEVQARLDADQSGDRLSDASLSAISALVQSGSAPAALFGGLLSDQLGTNIAQGADNLSRGLLESRSTEQQEREQTRQIIQQLDQAESRGQRDSELSVFNEGGRENETVANLREVGRNTLNTAKNIGSDPDMLLSITAQGIGSLGASVPIVRGAQIATRGTKLASSGAALGVGTVEAAGTYSGTVNEVLGMSEEDLSQRSPEYLEMRQNGTSHEDAQRIIANDAGLAAAAVQFPVAVAIGKTVGDFEANPLKSGSTVGALRNIGSQTIEESVQGATSEISQDLAIRQTADQDRTVGQGVGQALVEGAIGGLGAAGAAQAPGTALRATGITGRYTKELINKRFEAIQERQDGPVNQETTAKASEEATEKLAKVVNDINSPTTPSTGGGNESADVENVDSPLPQYTDEQIAFGQKAASLITIGGEEIAQTPRAIQKLLFENEEEAAQLTPEDTFARFEGLQAVLDNFRNKKRRSQLNKAEQTLAALWLKEQADRLNELMSEDISFLPGYMQQDIKDGSDAVNTILSDPTLKKLVEEAEQFQGKYDAEALGETPKVTRENVTSDEVVEALKVQATLARHNPTGIDEEFVDGVLQHNPNMDQKTRKSLLAARGLVEEAKRADALKEEIQKSTREEVNKQPDGEKVKLSVPSDFVRKDIKYKGLNRDKEQFGLSEHQTRIQTAMESNDLAQATKELDRLRNFAIHMTNKVQAARESWRRGDASKVPFRTWHGTYWTEAEDDSSSNVFVRRTSPNSIQLAREIVIDASSVISTYNNLVDIYGDQLNFEKLEGVDTTNITKKFTDVDEDLLAPAETAEPQAEAVEAQEQVSEETSTSEAEPEAQETADGTGEASEETQAFQENQENQQGRDESGTQGDPERLILVSPSNKIETRAAKKALRALKKTFREAKKAWRENWNADTRAVRPLTARMIKEDYKIDPDGPVGQELKRRDITPRNTPGLFRRGGLKNLDNLVQQDWEEKLPGITDKTFSEWDPDGDLNGYLNEDGLINLIAEEEAGNGAWLYTRQAAIEIEEAIEEIEDMIQEIEEELEALEIERQTGVKPEKGKKNASDDEQGSGPSEEGDRGGVEPPEPDAGTDEGGESQPDAAQGPEETASGTEEEVDVETDTEGETEPESGDEPDTKPSDEHEFISEVNFPKLTEKGESRVLRAYRFKKSKAKTLNNANPLSAFVKVLEKFDAFGVETTYEVTEEAREKLSTFVSHKGSMILKKMNDRLKEKASSIKGGKLTPLEALDPEKLAAVTSEKSKTSGKNWYDPTGWASTRNLALVDLDAGTYQSRLHQAAVLATLDWFLNQTGPDYQLSDEQIAKRFGVDEALVGGNIKIAARRGGLPAKRVIESLAQNIKLFWGVEENPEAPISDQIAEGLAAEILTAVKDDLFETLPISLPEGDTVSVIPTLMEDKEFAKAIGSNRKLLRDFFLTEPEHEYYFAVGPEQLPNRQKRNLVGQLSDEMKEAVKVHQNRPNYRNTPFFRTLSFLGKDTVLDLLGYDRRSEETTHSEHMESIKGKNQNLERAWDEVQLINSDLEFMAAVADVTPEEMGLFHEYYVSSNDRITAKGFSGQADKLMREVFPQTYATLDLSGSTDESLEDLSNFWITVAQSIGVKTEIEYREDAYEQTIEKLSGLRDAIALLKAIHTEQEVTPEMLETAKAQISAGGPVSVKFLHALDAVARLEVAQEQFESAPEGLTEFRHTLALEADGKTDGPFHALLMYTTGSFTPEQLDLYAKGGLFLGTVGKTLNQYYHEAVDGDIYQLVSSVATGFVNQLRAILTRKSDDVGKQAAAFYRIMENFPDKEFVNVEVEEDILTLTRMMAKNPTTISIYGSRKTGMAKKVASALVTTLYKRMTELMELRQTNPNASFADLPGFDSYPQLANDLQLVFGSFMNVQEDKKTGKISFYTTNGSKLDLARLKSNLKTFKISPVQFEALTSNVENLYVTPLFSAIEEVIAKNTQNLTHRMEFATQIMSTTFQTMFWDAISEREAELVAQDKLEPGSKLPRTEYNKILKELSSRFGAVIENFDESVGDKFHLNLSMSEKTKSPLDLVRDMDGAWPGKAALPAPSDARVKISPMMTISRGDARMMVHFHNGEQKNAKVQAVYDGLEMSADEIAVVSEAINKAVADTILENPIEDFAKSFQNFVRNLNDEVVETLDKYDAFAELRDPTGAVKLSKDNLLKNSKRLADYFDRAAASIGARKKAMAEVGFSMDHMASGEKPHNQQSSYETAAATPAELVARLNDIYARELKTDVLPPLQDNRPVVKAISEHSELVSDGVKKVPLKVLLEALKTSSMSKEVTGLLEVLAEKLPRQGNVFFGDSPTLVDFFNKVEGTNLQWSGLGAFARGSGNIYIADPTAETVLHELMHAATDHILSSHYNNVGTLSETESAAIQNLEKLMWQFLELNPAAEKDLETAMAVRSAQNQIKTHLQKWGDATAPAMGEFISWALANQHVTEVLKTTRVASPLVRLIDAALKGLRKLLGLAPSQRMDLFSNVVFNTAAMVRTGPIFDGTVDVLGTYLLEHAVTGTNGAGDPRLQNVLRTFNDKIVSHLRGLAPTQRFTEHLSIVDVSRRAANHFVAHGFDLSNDKLAAFKAIQAAFASTMQFDSNALSRANEIFLHVTKNFSRADFRDEGINTLMGVFGTQEDQLGRSNMLASFLALATVYEPFRQILNGIPLPKNPKIKVGADWTGTDDFVNSLGDYMMNQLSTAVTSADRKSPNVQAEIDKLIEILAEIEKDHRTWLERQSASLLDKGDAKISGMFTKAGNWLWDYASSEVQEAQSNQAKITKRALRSGARILSGLLDGNKGELVAVGYQQAKNELDETSMLRPLYDLMDQMIGFTPENEKVYELVNLFKYRISKMRQEHREDLPKIFEKQFSRKLQKAEWENLHLGLGKADIAALVRNGQLDLRNIREMLTDSSKLQDAINDAKAELGSLVQNQRILREYLQRAEDLAKKNVLGEIDPNNQTFYKNAFAIVVDPDGRNLQTYNEDVIDAIDRYTTLLSLEILPKGAKKTLADLAEHEGRGIDFLVYYLADLRAREAKKAENSWTARINGHKGFIPAEKREGASLIVADDADKVRLQNLGYTRLGDYVGSGLETGRKGYYFSTVAGNNTFQQGALQTVQKSVFGVDPRTGFSLIETGGRITGEAAREIDRRIQNNRGHYRGEPLIKVYRQVWNGQRRRYDTIVVGYERHMKPEMVKSLHQNRHLGKMIGAWKGRQLEELVASRFNETLIDRLHDMWEIAKREGRETQFTEVSDPDNKDEILQDVWNVIPSDTKQYIKDRFGDDGFMVNKSVLNVSLGYRMASVGEAWVGPSRLNDSTKKALWALPTLVFGRNAYKYMVTAESGWQAGISVAKNTIVIRSVIVPVNNLISNALQLMTMGIGLRAITKGFTSKLVEIQAHLKSLDRIVEIDALLARFKNDPARVAKLKAEKKALQDASRRMSIWPLIAAGEFTTISEGLTDADAAISQGRWADYVNDLIERHATKGGTLARYALLTRDTALFQGMARAVQYGDFLAKGIMYDHMIKQEGLNQKEALRRVTEEFVNYNLLPGRTFSYAESIGLGWFWMYKIQSMKVALNHLREHPLRALILIGGQPLAPDVPIIDVGSPIEDNAASVFIEGRQGFSLGLDMLWRAPSLNPWINLVH